MEQIIGMNSDFVFDSSIMLSTDNSGVAAMSIALIFGGRHLRKAQKAVPEGTAFDLT